MSWKKHCYRVGSHSAEFDDIPTEEQDLGGFVALARKRIEPWLSAIFQAEHLNLLIGSGFTSAIAHLSGSRAAGMGQVVFGTEHDAAILTRAQIGASIMHRDSANIEDQLRVALSLMDGLLVIDAGKAEVLKQAIGVQMSLFLSSLLETEAGIASGKAPSNRQKAEAALQSFLLSFASRAASRERLHVFTTNYDRLIEHGTNPGMGVAVTGHIPALNEIDEKEKAFFEKSLSYMGLQPGANIKGKKVDYVFIGSCTNSRIEDLRMVASFVKGKKKVDDVEVWIVPGSKQVEKQAIEEGIDKILSDAGFLLRQPGCSACLGMNEDKIPAGKYCISTSNRNFEGRQGAGARTLLASPLTAAAAAITGVVTDVRELLN